MAGVPPCPNDEFTVMQKMLAAGMLCLVSLLSVTSAQACERRWPEANDDDRTRHVFLTAAMTDTIILQRLRLAPDRAEVERKESSSSVAARYTYFDRTVTITRAASSGVQVELQEKGRDKLVWKLGSCARGR